MSDELKDKIDSAVGKVLFDVSNFPAEARPRLWGRDMGTLREKIVAGVLSVLESAEAGQVPGSWPTREQVANRLVERLRNSGEWPINEVWQRWQNLFTEYDRDIALFSQPTPGAEAVCVCGHPEFDHGHSEGDGCLHCACKEFATSAPSIADPSRRPLMTPGTTFTRAGLSFRVLGQDIIQDTAGRNYHQFQFDPSTIRDVTPPKE